MKGKPSITAQDFTPAQLMEADACTRCGECVKWCPTYDGRKKPRGLEPRDKFVRWRDWMNKSYGWRARLFGPKAIPEEDIKQYTQDLYECTTCGCCATVCCAGINTIEFWESNRANLVMRGNGPVGKQSLFPKLIGEMYNPYMKEQKDRLVWVPDDVKVAQKSDVLYFVGCTAGFNQSPNQGAMAASTARILNMLGIDFMLLGTEEWCCGSALIRTGQKHINDVPKNMALHNVEAIKARGPKRVVFACAGCFRASKIDWPRYYGGPLPFESVHMSQLLAEELAAGKIDWKGSLGGKTITYHDPCHLGRHVGVYEEPRKFLESMPGINLVEMKRNRELQRCCGAGGGCKAGLPDLALAVAQDRVRDAEEVNAEVLLSGCPFCRRNLWDGRDELKKNNLLKREMRVDDIVVIAAELLGLSTAIKEQPKPPEAPKAK